MSRKSKLFISYARPDQTFVEQLERDLSCDPGLDFALFPWSDSNLGVGNWQDELAANLADSDFFLTVISKHIYDEDGLRKWLDKESFAASVCEKATGLCSFIIRIDDTPVPPELKHRGYVDYRRPERGLQKLRRYILSEAQVRRLFFDRRIHLQACRDLLSNEQQCKSLIIHNESDAEQQGSSWLLQRLHIELAQESELYQSVLLFDSRVMKSPKAWLRVLEETVAELGQEKFSNYIRLRDEYSKISASVKQRSSSPIGVQPDHSFKSHNMELYPQRTMRNSSLTSPFNELVMIDALDMAWDLTQELLGDVACARLPLVWLLDWPRTAEPGTITSQWLRKLIYGACQPLQYYPWVVIASNKHILPEVCF